MILINPDTKFGRLLTWLYDDSHVTNLGIVYLFLGVIIADVLGFIF